jgi:hypothetical protein
LLDAFKGLEGTDEEAAANSGCFRADIEHEVVTVAEIDVGMATAEKHGAIAWGGAAKVVRCGIARRVGLGFDNAPDKAGTGEFADDDFAEKEASQRHSRHGEFGTA